MIDVRREAPQDTPAVYEVNEQAFGGTAEAELVNALRAREKHLISLVALDGGKIVGHILCSPMTVENQPSNRFVIGLAPLAVLPTFQNKGVGSQLVRASLEECRRNGFQIVAVLGHRTTTHVLDLPSASNTISNVSMTLLPRLSWCLSCILAHWRH